MPLSELPPQSSCHNATVREYGAPALFEVRCTMAERKVTGQGLASNLYVP
jgi:hypothetical protein